MLSAKDGEADLPILESCYRDTPDDAAWAQEIAARMEALCTPGAISGFVLFREQGSARRLEMCHSSEAHRDTAFAVRLIVECMDEAAYRSTFYPQRTVLLFSSIVRRSPRTGSLFRAIMGAAGATDSIRMVGYPAPGWTFGMGLLTRTSVVLTPATRVRLRHLRTHLESALRLRLFAPARPSAVILPSGRLEHVADEIKDREPALELAERTKRIESVRRRSTEPGALATWTALVEGTWSLVEHVEPGGPRRYHAYENAPHVRHTRALSEQQALVVELFTRGQTGKEIAYATGLSESSVSRTLSSAAEKLGFGSRADLLRGLGLLRTEPRQARACVGPLTNTEQEVLALLREGLRNAEIAAQRGTSVHTVANQVASILRKTGSKSRRGLITAGR